MNITEAVLDQMNRNPLYHVMGIQIQEAHAGKARGQLQPQSGICWPFPQQPHGGVLFTLMDTTMAWGVPIKPNASVSCVRIFKIPKANWSPWVRERFESFRLIY
jgi:acyl-coenzyme A thioesterase PaaI-like protein